MKFRVKNLNAEGPQTSFNEWRSRQLGKSGWGGVPVLTTADTVKVVRSWPNPAGLQDSATLLEIECTTVQNKNKWRMVCCSCALGMPQNVAEKAPQGSGGVDWCLDEVGADWSVDQCPTAKNQPVRFGCLCSGCHQVATAKIEDQRSSSEK
jgi:hypothetical protein